MLLQSLSYMPLSLSHNIKIFILPYIMMMKYVFICYFIFYYCQIYILPLHVLLLTHSLPSIFSNFFISILALKCDFGHVASKDDLIPPVPILTRYKKEVGIKAFVKKELFDPRLPDERRSTEINVLTTPTLCVQLNTLYVSSILTWTLFSNE